MGASVSSLVERRALRAQSTDVIYKDGNMQNRWHVAGLNKGELSILLCAAWDGRMIK